MSHLPSSTILGFSKIEKQFGHLVVIFIPSQSPHVEKVHSLKWEGERDKLRAIFALLPVLSRSLLTLRNWVWNRQSVDRSSKKKKSLQEHPNWGSFTVGFQIETSCQKLHISTQSFLYCDTVRGGCGVESLGFGARLLGVHNSAQNFQAVEPWAVSPSVKWK